MCTSVVTRTTSQDSPPPRSCCTTSWIGCETPVTRLIDRRVCCCTEGAWLARVVARRVSIVEVALAATRSRDASSRKFTFYTGERRTRHTARVRRAWDARLEAGRVQRSG